METALEIGPERLAPGLSGSDAVNSAALSISKGLVVNARKGSGVIVISFRNSDPKAATAVLVELVSRYFAKHLEVHRSTDAFEFVNQQTEQVRDRLRQTEDALKQMKSKAGIISLPDSTSSLTSQLSKSQTELRAAEAELSEQIARVGELEKWIDGSTTGNSATSLSKDPRRNPRSEGGRGAIDPTDQILLSPLAGKSEPSSSEMQRYRAMVERLAILRQSELELLSKYTEDNDLIKVSRNQIRALDAQRKQLEAQFPHLVVTAPALGMATASMQPDIVSERAHLAALEAKVKTLKLQVQEVEETFKQFSDLEMQIAQLERRRQVEEDNYKYFGSSVEKARIDEALDPAKIPNISVVQKPSFATRVTGQAKKIILILIGGGVVLGIAIAFLIELLLDRSVKRASEVEARLGIPILKTIPLFAGGGRDRNQLMVGGTRKNSSGVKELAKASLADPSPWEIGHFIRPYCDAIRDKIILYFDINRLTHKPKLVAVTACDFGAGTSTVAAGLAASLSETGDGKVLLVDMNDQRAEIHPFFDGKSACSLSEAIEPGRNIISASENLYLASVTPELGGGNRIAPRRFHELFPSLKASDFDYIIFDMPPLNQSTATLSVAGFMDKVVVIIEAEKNKPNEVAAAFNELEEVKANIIGIFNKRQNYFPKWLGIET